MSSTLVEITAWPEEIPDLQAMDFVENVTSEISQRNLVLTACKCSAFLIMGEGNHGNQIEDSKLCSFFYFDQPASSEDQMLKLTHYYVCTEIVSFS